MPKIPPKPLPSAERCVERVSDGTGFHWFQCSRRGVVDRNGKLYCHQHDPMVRAEKRAARDAQWNTELTALHEKERQAEAAQELLVRKAAAFDRIMALYHDDSLSTHDASYQILNLLGDYVDGE